MQTAEDITTSPKTVSRRPKMIPIERLIQLKDKNLTDQEVATILGCDRSNVSRRLAEHAPRLQRIDNHKKYRADILTSIQADVLESITPDNIKDCTLPQKTVAYGILVDKERLFRGESTSNLSIASVIETQTANMDAISSTIARLSQELDSE